MRSLRLARDYTVVLALLVLFGALSLLTDAFLQQTNLVNLLDQSVAVGVIAAGGTLVIIGGGFDLSTGAVFAVAGVVAALVAKDTGAELGLLAGVAIGLGFGIVNGMLVTLGRITPFLATLGAAIMIGGVGTVLTGGYLISVGDPSFTFVGREKVLGVKIAVWTFAVFTIALGLLLSRTSYGRMVYAVGSNREVARLSGVRVDLVRAATFAVSGLSAGVAGVIAASNLGQGQAGVGAGLTLSAIAAIAIGGTSVTGGQGAMWRTVVGVLMISLLNNGFNLLKLEPAYRDVAIGAIIVLAVAIDAASRR